MSACKQDVDAACRRLVRELAATDPFAATDGFACAYCDVGPFQTQAHEHDPDCLWRQAVELSARMAPGWEPVGTPAGEEEGA